MGLIDKNALLLSTLKLILIDSEQIKSWNDSKSVLKRSKKEIKYLHNMLENYNIEKLIFLQIDGYVIQLGSWKNMPACLKVISGILLSPYTHMPSKMGLMDYTRRLRKKWQLTYALKNPRLKNIYILNDENSVLELNNLFSNRSVFSYLVDPNKQRSYQKIDIRNKFSIESEKLIILFAGGIQHRKNLVRCIQAIDRLSIHDKKSLYILIMGNCSDILLFDEIKSEIKKTRDVTFQLYNEYLSTDELESCFDTSDLVLLAYSNFYSSSGILGNAAKHGKCILATKYGVIGQITDKYKLGYLVDPFSTEDIQKGIKLFISERQDSWMRPEYIGTHTHLHFGKTLITE